MCILIHTKLHIQIDWINQLSFPEYHLDRCSKFYLLPKSVTCIYDLIILFIHRTNCVYMHRESFGFAYGCSVKLDITVHVYTFRSSGVNKIYVDLCR